MVGTSPAVNRPFEKCSDFKEPRGDAAEGPDRAGYSPFKTHEAIKHGLYQEVACAQNRCAEPSTGSAQALWI